MSRSGSSKGSRSRSRSYSPSRPIKSNQENNNYDSSTKENNIEATNVIAIFNLNLKTTQDDLKEYFGKYGSIQNCRLVMDQKRNKSRGFAFLTFEKIESAIEAKTQGHGIILHEKEIRVDYSTTKRPHSPTPGVYLGHKPGNETGSKLPPEKREKSISPDRPPVIFPYKGRSRTKSLSPDSLKKRTEKVRKSRDNSEKRKSRDRSPIEKENRNRKRSRDRDRSRDRNRNRSRSRDRDRNRNRNRSRSRDRNRNRKSRDRSRDRHRRR